jgi:hypothetical protein
MVGVGEAWMGKHELAELDQGGPFAALRFVGCGSTEPGGWPSRLLNHERRVPLTPKVWVLSGQLDALVSYESSDHPQQQEHDVVNGTDHTGILKHEKAVAKVKTVCGGTF